MGFCHLTRQQVLIQSQKAKNSLNRVYFFTREKAFVNQKSRGNEENIKSIFQNFARVGGIHGAPTVQKITSAFAFSKPFVQKITQELKKEKTNLKNVKKRDSYQCLRLRWPWSESIRVRPSFRELF